MTEPFNKVFVASPAFGQTMYSHTGMSLFRLAQHLEHLHIPAAISTVSFPDIADVRNLFLTLWYDKTDASHILFVDADMDFHSQLVIDMLAFDKPVVGALYPARVMPLKFVGRAKSPDADPCFTNGHIKVDGVGAGILLVSRECVTQMLAADPSISTDKLVRRHTANNLFEQMNLTRLIRAFEQLVDVDDVKLAEDLSFCQRWKTLCNGDVWANIAYDIGHTGPYRFSGRYADLFKNVLATDGPVREQIQAGTISGAGV